jgi:hypothetical protein
LIFIQPFKKSTISIIFLFVVLLLASSYILTISLATSPPIIPPVTPPPGTANNTLVYDLTSSENRTILPIQMMLPDGTWSQPVKYNFDTGALWPTDVAPQFLSAFGYGPDGVGSDSSKREAQPGKIRIVGLDKDIDLPVMVQDKAHYDLFREQPPPERYHF